MALRTLDVLAAPVREAAMRLRVLCQSEGIDLLIYCTLRQLSEQAALYAQGRTRPGPIVTNARPGNSLHNPDCNGQSWAFDAVPLVAGKAAWDNPALVERMGILGEACGLQWAGRWQGALREAVHFQMARPAEVGGAP